MGDLKVGLDHDRQEEVQQGTPDHEREGHRVDPEERVLGEKISLTNPSICVYMLDPPTGPLGTYWYLLVPLGDRAMVKSRTRL